MKTALEIARDYQQRGWAPIPIKFREKGCFELDWQNLRLTTDDLSTRFNGAPQNIGVLTGAPSGGLVDVDLDRLVAVDLAAFLLPPTGAIFGRKSKPRSHWLYKIDDGAIPDIDKWTDPNGGGDDKATLLELRGSGGQTIFPGSTHRETGEAIEWDADGEPARVSCQALRTAVQRIAAAALIVPHWVEGKHDDVAAALIGSLLRAGWAHAEIEQLVVAIATVAGDDKLEKRLGKIERLADELDVDGADAKVPGLPKLREALNDSKTARAVEKWLELRPVRLVQSLPAPGQTYAATDTGNARRFLDANRDDVRYVAEWREWIEWREAEQRWVRSPEALGCIARMKRSLSTALGTELSTMKPADQQAHARWLINSQNTNRLEAAVRNARSEPGVVIEAAALDANRYLVGTLNGTLDLRSGEHRPATREDLITKRLGCAFDADAKCPVWDAVLSDAMGGSVGMVKYLQRIVGMSLLGNLFRLIVFIYGPTATAKSVFLEVVKAMHGDYGKAAGTDLLMLGALRSKHGPTEALARLAGARLVTVSETNSNDTFDEGLLKDLTGNDTVSARHLHERSFEFRPDFVLFVRGNHKPKFSGDDAAMLDRLRLVPFMQQVPLSKRIPRLAEQIITDELPGVLAWAARAAMEVQATQSIATPKEVAEATQEYAREMDLLGQFLEEKCTVDNEETRRGARPEELRKAPAAALYKTFFAWCEEQGVRYPWTQQTFGRRMSERFVKVRHGNGHAYLGVTDAL